MPAFGLRPDPDFISKYYSHTGWTYQMRRTWHGIQPTIGHQPLFTDRQSIYQISRRWLFYYAKQALKTMSPATLNLYKLMRYPDHVLPENRFVRMYMRENIAPSTSQGYILNEDGSIIKTEDDHFIVQET